MSRTPLMVFAFVLACSQPEPAPTTTAAPPTPVTPPVAPVPALPLPTPEPQTAEAVPTGVIEFTPEAVCLGGHLTRLHPPCDEEPGNNDLRIDGGKRVGMIRSGEAVDVAGLCRYGTVAEVGDRFVMWWPKGHFTDQGHAKAEVSRLLSMTCEDVGWIAAGVVTLSGGLPTEVDLTDSRFSTRGGARVGMSPEAFKAALPGGAIVPGVYDGDEAYAKDGITAPLLPRENEIKQLNVAL